MNTAFTSLNDRRNTFLYFLYLQIFQKVHPSEKTEENMRQVLSNLELKLKGKRFLAGQNITLADVFPLMFRLGVGSTMEGGH